jgi:chromosome segregation ATPase
MNDWRSVRSRIERDTGVQFPRATATAAVEIDRFLNLDLRHHQASLDDLLSRDDVSDDVKTLYRVFVAACEGAEIDEASLEAVQARLAEIEALMGPLLADLRSRERKLTADVATLNDAHAGARGQADALAEDLAEARSKLSKLKKSLDVLDSEFEHAVRLVEQRVERRLADAETERDELLQEIRAEKERVEEREAELRKLGEEAQHFRALSARSEAKLTKFEDDLEQVELEMENTLQAVEQRIATVESSLRDTRMERDRLAAERELLVNERDLLAGERDALAAERELLVNERDLLAGERDALAADLAAANSTLDRFRRSVSWRMTRPVRWVGRQFTRRPG